MASKASKKQATRERMKQFAPDNWQRELQSRKDVKKQTATISIGGGRKLTPNQYAVSKKRGWLSGFNPYTDKKSSKPYAFTTGLSPEGRLSLSDVDYDTDTFEGEGGFATGTGTARVSQSVRFNTRPRPADIFNAISSTSAGKDAGMGDIMGEMKHAKANTNRGAKGITGLDVDSIMSVPLTARYSTYSWNEGGGRLSDTEVDNVKIDKHEWTNHEEPEVTVYRKSKKRG